MEWEGHALPPSSTPVRWRFPNDRAFARMSSFSIAAHGVTPGRRASCCYEGRSDRHARHSDMSSSVVSVRKARHETPLLRRERAVSGAMRKRFNRRFAASCRRAIRYCVARCAHEMSRIYCRGALPYAPALNVRWRAAYDIAVSRRWRPVI